jgi:hypothetical protein
MKRIVLFLTVLALVLTAMPAMAGEDIEKPFLRFKPGVALDGWFPLGAFGTVLLPDHRDILPSFGIAVFGWRSRKDRLRLGGIGISSGSSYQSEEEESNSALILSGYPALVRLRGPFALSVGYSCNFMKGHHGPRYGVQVQLMLIGDPK